MKNQPITLDNLTDYLMPMTTLRRDPNAVAEKAARVGGVIITKDGEPFLKIISVKPKVNYYFDESPLDKIKAIAGGLHLGKDFTAGKINKLLDREYE